MVSQLSEPKSSRTVPNRLGQSIPKQSETVLDCLGLFEDVITGLGSDYGDGTGSKAAAVRRILKRLETLGLIESKRVGLERCYHQLNTPEQPQVYLDCSNSSGAALQGISPGRESVQSCSKHVSEHLEQVEQAQELHDHILSGKPQDTFPRPDGDSSQVVRRVPSQVTPQVEMAAALQPAPNPLKRAKGLAETADHQLVLTTDELIALSERSPGRWLMRSRAECCERLALTDLRPLVQPGDAARRAPSGPALGCGAKLFRERSPQQVSSWRNSPRS